MLRFSNKVKYGLQFLLFLDVDTEEYTDIQRAAISCEIPHKFLEGIAVTLKKHGILEVKRGAGGGYRLTRDPRNVSLAQIIEALEGISGKPNSKSLELTGQVIDEILADTIVEFRKQMESITLQDIHKKYYESADKLMYYI
ncbi:RrF2 family transcriptional regulator [Xiashengella succiniciproducens]|jgi:Rrf2 family cysteine metabolism transcriptional repressor|uniref:Rrf2 family transcriptional regulator n=1 Tax=Xiashengella succiniciproducens TaxID=2949635 RepID=A0A9J6ZNL9_9BACT|nr:Rrf2 family transcriptional regulator [Alkaliflexus sp. Ai-910]MDI9538054.1 Rrf2 family transcriptional regulator [Bacteroidota bacterium]URW79126.1 Rrf2 family transcriptional regulator [Alkaliflexus sp. Ai-910]HHU00253.1 Rrf2 family transcriptional regulator [Bacteroidales bacterium]